VGHANAAERQSGVGRDDRHGQLLAQVVLSIT
jgi:hypothetical protein